MENEFYHFGVLGMKWGHRKNNYRSTGIRSYLARRENEKIDKSFRKWKENTKNKEDAIELGKKANDAKISFENDPSNKDLKLKYKSANKEYKKALQKNTTYRKGSVREAVGQDISRKYLSEAKKISKSLKSDPNNKELNKKYNSFMSKHDVERAKARKAQRVAANRSNLKASIKRSMTLTVKAAAATGTILLGSKIVNDQLQKRGINGRVNTAAVVDTLKRTSSIIQDTKKYF